MCLSSAWFVMWKNSIGNSSGRKQDFCIFKYNLALFLERWTEEWSLLTSLQHQKHQHRDHPLHVNAKQTCEILGSDLMSRKWAWQQAAWIRRRRTRRRRWIKASHLWRCEDGFWTSDAPVSCLHVSRVYHGSVSLGGDEKKTVQKHP